MTKDKNMERQLPQGTLQQAIEIVRDNDMQNPSLHIKLQEELAKPLNLSVREEAANTDRISKLKAPAGLLAGAFMK